MPRSFNQLPIESALSRQRSNGLCESVALNALAFTKPPPIAYLELDFLARISHQFGPWFSCIAGFREIFRFAQNDNLKQCVILRGGLCPEESLRRFEGEEIFLADVIAACEKWGLALRLYVTKYATRNWRFALLQMFFEVK